MLALLLWKRVVPPSRLPREQFSRAIVSGIRYVTNSPSVKIVLIRSIVTGVIGSAIIGLMPIVARDLLHGGAQTYGLLLSAFGLGAVIGALYIPEMRKRLNAEPSIRACALSMGGSLLTVALSRDLILIATALVLAGGRMDDGMGAVQRRHTAVSAPLGCRALARGLSGGGIRRDCDR